MGVHTWRGAAGGVVVARPEERRTRSELASRRRLRLVVGSALATVLVGLLAVVVVAVVMMAPQLDQLSALGDNHARAVAAASQLRARLAATCRRATAAITTPGTNVDASAALQQEQLALDRLESYATDPEERVAMLRMRTGLRRAITSAARVERALAAGDRGAAATEAASLVEHGDEVSHAADALVRHNALEVRELASAVRASLRRGTALASAMTLAVVAVALVLMRQAARAEAAHVALLTRNQAEMAAFASRAAHELRTPLQSLRLALHVLRTSPGQSLALERALRSARRMQQIIDDVLRFSRSGGAPEPGVRCVVGAVVSEVLAELGPRAGEVGLALSTELQEGLAVAMAPGHLRIIVSNLVGNALKYGASEGGRVTVRAAARGGSVVLSVSDTGAGISPEARARLFEPFYRGSNKPDGYGLGLATVKRLVEAHGGKVELESEVGSGTTVTVELPRATAPEPMPV